MGLHLPIFCKNFLVGGNLLHHLKMAGCKRQSRLVDSQQIWGALGGPLVGAAFAALAPKQHFGAGDALQQPDVSSASSPAGDGQGARDPPSRGVPHSWGWCPPAFKHLHQPHAPIAVLSRGENIPASQRVPRDFLQAKRNPCRETLRTPPLPGSPPGAASQAGVPCQVPTSCCPRPPHPLGLPTISSITGGFCPASPTASVPRVNI